MLHSLRRFCGFVSTFFLVGVFDCVTHWILNLDYRDLLCISVHFIQHRRQQNAAAHTDKYTCTHAHTCTCTSLIWISIQKSISECASMIDGADLWPLLIDRIPFSAPICVPPCLCFSEMFFMLSDIIVYSRVSRTFTALQQSSTFHAVKRRLVAAISHFHTHIHWI